MTRSLDSENPQSSPTLNSSEYASIEHVDGSAF